MYFFPWFFVLGFFWGGVWGIFNWSSPPLFFVLVCVFIFVFKSKTVFLFCFGLLPTESPVFFTICSANSTIPSRWPQRIIYFFTLLSVILPCFFHCNNFILVGISWVYPLFSSGLSETFSLENMHILQVQTTYGLKNTEDRWSLHLWIFQRTIADSCASPTSPPSEHN